MKRLLLFLLFIYQFALADSTTQTATVFYDPTTHKIKKPPVSGSTPYDYDFTGLSIGGVAVGSFQPVNDFLTSLSALNLTDSMFYMVDPSTADIVTQGIGITFSAGTIGVDPTVIGSRPEDVGPTSDDFVLTLDSTSGLLKKVSLGNFASNLTIADVVDSVTGFTLSIDTSAMTHDAALLIPAGSDTTSVIPATRPAGQFILGIGADGNVQAGYLDTNNQSAFGADQNNLVPTGDTFFQNWSSSVANTNVTGLAGGVSGETKIIRNAGTSNTVTIKNESSSSTAANRFRNTTGADIVLSPAQEVIAHWDNVASRWAVDSLAGSSGGSGATIATTTDVIKGDNSGNGIAFGSSTVGRNILALTNPGAQSMVSIDASNNALTRTFSQVRTDITAAASGANTDITSVRLANTGDHIKDTGGTFDLILKPNETNTANRTLNLKLNDADRTISLTGNLQTGSSFTTSGAFALTLTATGATNVTLPTTGTLLTSSGAVTSVAKNGSTALHGDVTFSGGSNVTLTQTGNDISIASTGGGGSGVTSVATNSPINGGTITSTGTIGLDTSVNFLFSAAQTISLNDTTANGVSTGLLLTHNTTGTPANGLGTGIAFFGESSTTAGQPMGQLNLQWSTVTDASRTAFMDFILTNNATDTGSKARLFGSGGFSVNSTTDPGAGIINANSGFDLGGAEFPTAANGFVTRTAANTYSATTAPTGAVVGTTDSQALTNKDLSGAGNTFPTFNQNTTGSAAKWTTARTLALTGDVTYTSGSFDGSGNATGTATLANIPAIAGTNLTGTADGFTAGDVTRNHAVYAGASPPTVDVGSFTISKTAVDMKTSGTTSVFTVPASRTFVCTGAYFIVTSVTTGGAGTETFKIQESGASGAMTPATTSGSSTPVAGMNYAQTLTPAGGPYRTCATGNIVQVVVSTSQAGSTAVSGTIFVQGYYSS